MFEINGKKVNGNVVLAPMAGYTSFGYRKFMIPFGISICYTEMISDMGLIYQNKETLSYLNFPKTEIPTGVQLFGNDPENLAKAAKIAQNLNKNIDFFDVNMACPVPKVTKVGSGSALMNDPKKCGEIIRAIKLETNLPVSAKIRLGWDDKNINYFEVISELEKAGVCFVAIHARTRKELYSGTPHFDLIKDLGKKMRVPLIVSGNIFTLEDAKTAIELTGAQMVMVARGGVGNPRLITDIDRFYKNKEQLLPPSFVEQKEYCLQLLHNLIDEKGEKRAVTIFRSMGPSFFGNIPNVKELKKQLACEITDYNSVVRIIERFEKEHIS